MSLRGDQIDYTSEENTKTLIVLSIPLVLEMMLQSIFEIVDIFFIGKLGANATAACRIGFIYYRFDYRCRSWTGDASGKLWWLDTSVKRR